MKKMLGMAVLLTLLGCGEEGPSSQVQRQGADLSKRVATLEDDLHQAKRQLIAQQQEIQTLTERLRAAEQNIDKLSYQTSIQRR